MECLILIGGIYALFTCFNAIHVNYKYRSTKK